MLPPVVLIVYKRIETTRRVLAAIREARPSSLFLIADGPRFGDAADAARCAEVRALVEDGVDWPCEVLKIYAGVNMGSAGRVSSGLNEVFARVEEAIILEDDCVPDATFFPFCSELLNRYRDDSRVAQIAGCSFQPVGVSRGGPSYYFSRYPHCWGWATWRRAWKHYDHSMTAWRADTKPVWLNRVCEDPAERRWWRAAFDATAAGRIDAWDFRWTVSVFSQSRLCILPYHNLVTNIGFGPDATNTHKKKNLLEIPVVSIEFPLVHPAEMKRDIEADAYSGRRMFRFPSRPRRMLSWLWHRFFT